MKTILVTGGAGFIGSNFIRLLLAETSAYSILNVDSLTYAGNLENLADVADDFRYSFVKADIADQDKMSAVFNRGPLWAVVNFAAESHVDRSITDPTIFVRTNVLGTQLLLNLARRHGVERFQQVSTDEVYGSLGATGKFTEDTQLAPNSPYAATKTAADLLCRAAVHTFNQPVVVTRCSNNYGPWQFPEKLIPLMIANALEDKPLPVYGKGENVNPRGPTRGEGRVCRGGYWTNQGVICRSATRKAEMPGVSWKGTGFRVAVNAKPAGAK